MPLNINRDLRFPKKEYISSNEKKSGIAIHHTVGGTAASTFDWWMKDKQIVGTAYIIDRDGTTFEVFEPEAWAYQFGLKWPPNQKMPFEKRFIGIEIASEGALIDY